MYNKFRQLIEEKGITPYRVAMDTGIPQTTFSRWKLGVSAPKLDKLQKIATYLGVKLEDLI